MNTDAKRARTIVRALHRSNRSLLVQRCHINYEPIFHILLEQPAFSPLEAIAAGTSVARVIGASGDVGKIAPGLLADIVILDADPTNDIRNTRRIWRVIQGGRVVDRQNLVSPGWDTTGLP